MSRNSSRKERIYLRNKTTLDELNIKINDASEDSDTNKSFSKIWRTKGYSFERHKVLTEDGYWLSLFRIPGSKGETAEHAKRRKKPAVFLQHGIFDSADTFIMNEEKRATAFILANNGYDVGLSHQYQFLHCDLFKISQLLQLFWSFWNFVI